MGVSVNNVQLRVTNGLTVADVVGAVGQEAWVSPATDGWITVYPSDLGSCDGLAAQLSSTLGCVTMSFECCDSDFAAAVLFDRGDQLGRLEFAGTYYYDEEYGQYPCGPALLGNSDQLEVFGELEPWIAALGTGSKPDIVLELWALGHNPFAEAFAFTVLSALEFNIRRLNLAYRFIERDLDTDTLNTFAHTVRS